MRKRLYDTGDFKIYYPDEDNEEEDNFSMFDSLIKFIGTVVIVSFVIGLTLFYIL